MRVSVRELLVVVCLFGSLHVEAQSTLPGVPTSPYAHADTQFSHLFSTELPEEPERPRGYLLGPTLSLILPGLDQWYEGQNTPASLYSGMALSGLFVRASAIQRLGHEPVGVTLENRNDDVRAMLLGSQMYSAAGSFSAYSSFRSAVRSRRSLNEFTFLTEEETTDEILAAPFQFSLLKRSTTVFPLLLAIGVIGADLTSQGQRPFTQNSYNGNDFAYGSAFSYLAGTHEEALFRGWMMPVLRESWGSDFWSNFTTSALFAAAHISSDLPVPWPQFLLGYYMGYLTQKNNWTLQESIFVHAWWDVIVFAGIYLDKSREQRPEAWLHLPLVSTTF